jgi:hypothetical protein
MPCRSLGAGARCGPTDLLAKGRRIVAELQRWRNNNNEPCADGQPLCSQWRSLAVSPRAVPGLPRELSQAGLLTTALRPNVGLWRGGIPHLPGREAQRPATKGKKTAPYQPAASGETPRSLAGHMLPPAPVGVPLRERCSHDAVLGCSPRLAGPPGLLRGLPAAARPDCCVLARNRRPCTRAITGGRCQLAARLAFRAAHKNRPWRRQRQSSAASTCSAWRARDASRQGRSPSPSSAVV